MTLEQYDEVIYRMGFEPRGAGGPGSVFHLVAKTADGIRVTDVWETQEDFEKFSEEKIGPITQEVGIEGQPEIQFSTSTTTSQRAKPHFDSPRSPAMTVVQHRGTQTRAIGGGMFAGDRLPGTATVERRTPGRCGSLVPPRRTTTAFAEVQT